MESCTETWNLTIFWSPRIKKFKLLILGLEGFVVSLLKPCPRKFKRYGIEPLSFYSEQRNTEKKLTLGQLVASFLSWLKARLFSNLNLKLVSCLRFLGSWGLLERMNGRKSWTCKNSSQHSQNSFQTLHISRSYHCRARNGCSSC